MTLTHRECRPCVRRASAWAVIDGHASDPATSCGAGFDRHRAALSCHDHAGPVCDRQRHCATKVDRVRDHAIATGLPDHHPSMQTDAHDRHPVRRTGRACHGGPEHHEGEACQSV